MTNTPPAIVTVFFDEEVEREKSSVRRISRDQWNAVKQNILRHLIESEYKKPRFKYDQIVCDRKGYAFDFMRFIVLSLFTYIFWYSYKTLISSPFSLFDWGFPLLVSATVVFVWCSLTPVTLNWITWERSHDFVYLHVYGRRKDRLSFIDRIGLKPARAQKLV